MDRRIARLVAWQEAADITQTEFAKRLGVSQSALSKLLRGKLGVSIDVGAAVEAVTGGAIKLNEWEGYEPFALGKSSESGEHAATEEPPARARRPA